MKKKFFSVALSTVMLTCMLYGCAGSPQAPAQPAKEAEAAGTADSAADGEAAGEAEEEGAEEDAASGSVGAKADELQKKQEKRENYEENVMSGDTRDAVLTGDGTVTAFIGEEFYDGLINDEYDAMDAIYSVLDYVGGDNSTELDPVVIQPTEDGTTYYTFRQVAGDVAVYGATVKLIADKNKKAVGLVSSLVPELDVSSMDDWAIDAEEAETIVQNRFKKEKIKIIKNSTEQTLLPFEDAPDKFYYAWVVYSSNFYDDVDAAYLAHYVDESGEYLYSMPVSTPGSKEALAGNIAPFVFSEMKEDTWKGTVKTLKGETKEVEIPIMVDPVTGDKYLGDAKRQILCAEYPDFFFDDTLTPCVAENDRWEDESIITYDNFIKVYDFYKGTGWEGPDGDNTPALVLMNAVDEDGEPEVNACYTGKMEGFQIFEFDTTNPFGEAVDVMAHEYTHCFTTTTMTTNLYLNDYGAINEGMSDILGNLAAMMIDETDEPFVIGEKCADIVKRTMGDPNTDQQPEYVWDRYYLPEAPFSTEFNDNGGVHTNSSLLNILSYKLDKAGMDPSEQFYYWMNVSFAMTPKSDYTQMLYILPWVMERTGNTEYVPVINKALEETGLYDRDLPKTPKGNYGIVSVTIPSDEVINNNYINAVFFDMNEENDFITYPEAGTDRIAATLPAGKYWMQMQFVDPETYDQVYVLPHEGGWEMMAQDDVRQIMNKQDRSYTIDVKEGEVLELDGDALGELLLQ